MNKGGTTEKPRPCWDGAFRLIDMEIKGLQGNLPSMLCEIMENDNKQG